MDTSAHLDRWKIVRNSQVKPQQQNCPRQSLGSGRQGRAAAYSHMAQTEELSAARMRTTRFAPSVTHQTPLASLCRLCAEDTRIKWYNIPSSEYNRWVFLSLFLRSALSKALYLDNFPFDTITKQSCLFKEKLEIGCWDLFANIYCIVNYCTNETDGY